MKRALVLGGGGPVGIGWEAGLIVGLSKAGIELSGADAVVGTSAGSVVGFTLTSGQDLSAAVDLAGAGGSPSSEAANSAAPAAGAPAGAAILEEFMSFVAQAAADPDAAEGIRAQLGQLAESAPTVPETRWLEMFATFTGASWPSSFSCTAVDTATGRFQVWDQNSGVDPQLAIASSCAVPGIFPPVTIQGRRWMDGGVRDMLNADVAAGHDVVIAVSCTLLEIPAGYGTAGLDAVFGATRAQLDGLKRAGARVETVVPGQEMLEVSAFGMNLMDFTRAGDAYRAGLAQAEREASRLAEAWG